MALVVLVWNFGVGAELEARLSDGKRTARRLARREEHASPTPTGVEVSRAREAEEEPELGMSRFEDFGGEGQIEFGGGDEYLLPEEQLAAEDFGMFPDTEVGRAAEAPLGSQRASLPWNIEARSEAGRGQ